MLAWIDRQGPAVNRRSEGGEALMQNPLVNELFKGLALWEIGNGFKKRSFEENVWV